jgi:hypothetical protein
MKKGTSFLAGKGIFLDRAITSKTSEATPKRNSAIDPGEKSSKAALIPEKADAQKIMAIARAMLLYYYNFHLRYLTEYTAIFYPRVCLFSY